MAEWGYRLVHGVHLVRNNDTKMDVATSDGWRSCSRSLRWLLDRGRTRDLTSEQAENHLRRGCSALDIGAPAQKRKRRLLPWLINPPMGSAGSRYMYSAQPGIVSYLQALGDADRADLVADATAGYERARDKRDSVAARASVFLQAAGVTGTLVLANGALLIGDDSGLGEVTKVVVTVGLLAASLALIAAGVYGLLALTWSFGLMAPNNPARIIGRSKVTDEADDRRQAIAVLLLAQRRMSMVSDWKLDRVKRATFAFLVGIAGVAIATVAVVIEALAGG
jgi:hypothetical protein